MADLSWVNVFKTKKAPSQLKTKTPTFSSIEEFPSLPNLIKPSKIIDRKLNKTYLQALSVSDIIST
jgi:hypothetical protein